MIIRGKSEGMFHNAGATFQAIKQRTFLNVKYVNVGYELCLGHDTFLDNKLTSDFLNCVSYLEIFMFIFKICMLKLMCCFIFISF